MDKEYLIHDEFISIALNWRDRDCWWQWLCCVVVPVPVGFGIFAFAWRSGPLTLFA